MIVLSVNGRASASAYRDCCGKLVLESVVAVRGCWLEEVRCAKISWRGSAVSVDIWTSLQHQLLLLSSKTSEFSTQRICTLKVATQGHKYTTSRALQTTLVLLCHGLEVRPVSCLCTLKTCHVRPSTQFSHQLCPDSHVLLVRVRSSDCWVRVSNCHVSLQA